MSNDKNNNEKTEMSPIYEISDNYVEKIAELNPITATSLGIKGHETNLGDFTPEGNNKNASLATNTLKALITAPIQSEDDRRAKEVMTEDIETELRLHKEQEHYRSLNILHSPMHSIRMVFDHMPKNTVSEWENISERLSKIPKALSEYTSTLREGVKKNLVSTTRQSQACAAQAATWAGSNGSTSFFANILTEFKNADIDSGKLQNALEVNISKSENAYGKFSEFLATEYTDMANPEDAVGDDRYQLWARTYNGIDLDLIETYEWGWDQLRWVEEEMNKTAKYIIPGGSVEEAKNLLESDPKRRVDGVENFRSWMQNLQENTIEELNGNHFDIPKPVTKIEALIAPEGGALAMYYTRPSGDFSRPGRTWYPTGGKTSFPIWGEVSIAYHEGVPGHHFQIGTSVYLSETLSRYQRQLGGTSGYVEGWALYAERLMGELGYLENPDYYMGMLRAQALRSVRVILDIGMHLKLQIPQDSDFHPGQPWTPELGLAFIETKSHFPKHFVASEIDRYLGLPGQAISYKVGEKVWLETRESAKKKAGEKFNLKDWHTKALNLGGMGLSQMKRELINI